MSRIEHSPLVWGLVPAGGRGERFGGSIPKQFLAVGGKPLLQWTLERLLEARLAGVIVAVPAPWLAEARASIDLGEQVAWVEGGTTRQDSVAACLAECPPDVELVLVHDGARPATALTDIAATIKAVGEGQGAILGREVSDTIKTLEGDRIAGTVDRTHLLRAETPQVFRRSVLAEALERSRSDGFVGTDEASIVERLEGATIRYVKATAPNPKLTRLRDLPLLEMLLRREGDPS